MRTLSLALLLSLAAAVPAFAVSSGWHGPGWYIVMSSPMNSQSLYRGVYKSQDECMTDKPDDKGVLLYQCVQLYIEPMDATGH